MLEWVLLDRDAATVVRHPHAAVREQRDVDPVALTGKGFVDRVVHDFGNEVVEAA
jgi:hypothetical protein